jgi:hypothetical protein
MKRAEITVDAGEIKLLMMALNVLPDSALTPAETTTRAAIAYKLGSARPRSVRMPRIPARSSSRRGSARPSCSPRLKTRTGWGSDMATATRPAASPIQMAEAVARIDYYRRPDPKMQRTRARLVKAIRRACPVASAAQTEMEQARSALVRALDDLDAERKGEGHFATLDRLGARARRARADYVSLRDVWLLLVAKAA